MYSRESLISSLWPHDRDARVRGGRVMWNVISLQQGWEWEPHFVMFYRWQPDKWDCGFLFSYFYHFTFSLDFDEQWNEWDKRYGDFLMHSSLTPSVDGAECVQWTMNHDPESLESRGSKFTWSWLRALAGLHCALWGLARAEAWEEANTATGQQTLMVAALVQHFFQKFHTANDRLKGCWVRHWHQIFLLFNANDQVLTDSWIVS